MSETPLVNFLWIKKYSITPVFVDYLMSWPINLNVIRSIKKRNLTTLKLYNFNLFHEYSEIEVSAFYFIQKACGWEGLTDWQRENRYNSQTNPSYHTRLGTRQSGNQITMATRTASLLTWCDGDCGKLYQYICERDLFTD